ncbi:FAD binding domain-containing protein [Xylariaceae sp. FL0255]|nr:FAD binding domain-containing protein [Xylariaceae sp. FL0255]
MEFTNASAAQSPPTIYDDLKRILSPEATVFLTSNTNLATAGVTEQWNAFGSPIYVVYAKPASSDDVKTIVKYAGEQNVPFLAIGGGHGYSTTTSALKGGIGIDLGNFRDVKVDAENNRLTVGGGVVFNDIFDPLNAVGKEIQTGSCSYVGMVGATLGGGIGPYQGIHGLLLDALKSVTIVTGSNEIVTASEEENSDLFWGIRGAGQNFGVVTSATYQIFDQTNNGNAFNGDFVYPASAKETIFTLAKSISNDQPDALSMFPSIIYDFQTQQTAIMMSVIYVGPESEGQKYMQPFIDNGPIRQDVKVLPWNTLVKENRFGVDALACMKGGKHSVYGLNVKEFDVATYVDLVDSFESFHKNNPANVASILVLELFPNRVTQLVPDDATAFPYRSNLGYMFMSFIFADEAAAATAEAFAMATRDKLLISGGIKNPIEVYVNYAHGDEGSVAWYTERKLPKLLELKKQWDPKGLFNWSNPFNVAV